MKKVVLAILLSMGAAAFSAAGAQPAPAEGPAPAAEAPADKPTPGAEAKPAKKRSWWRNRQIERGPRALRPGHHRRLLRHSQ